MSSRSRNKFQAYPLTLAYALMCLWLTIVITVIGAR